MDNFLRGWGKIHKKGIISHLKCKEMCNVCLIIFSGNFFLKMHFSRSNYVHGNCPIFSNCCCERKKTIILTHRRSFGKIYMELNLVCTLKQNFKLHSDFTLSFHYRQPNTLKKMCIDKIFWTLSWRWLQMIRCLYSFANIARNDTVIVNGNTHTDTHLMIFPMYTQAMPGTLVTFYLIRILDVGLNVRKFAITVLIFRNNQVFTLWNVPAHMRTLWYKICIKRKRRHLLFAP